MSHVIYIIGLTNGDKSPYDGQYLSEYDPHRPGTDPNGEPMFAHVRSVPDRADAIHFDDMIAATQFWQQKVGTRPDGKPDRPLTAFTVVIQPVP